MSSTELQQGTTTRAAQAHGCRASPPETAASLGKATQCHQRFHQQHQQPEIIYAQMHLWRRLRYVERGEQVPTMQQACSVCLPLHHVRQARQGTAVKPQHRHPARHTATSRFAAAYDVSNPLTAAVATAGGWQASGQAMLQQGSSSALCVIQTRTLRDASWDAVRHWSCSSSWSTTLRP